MKTIKPKLLTLEEQQKIKTLSAAGWTIHAIARETGRDDHTVKNLIKRPEVAREIKELKGELADMFDGMARRLLESITPEDIDKINAYQRVIAASAATDKMRLLSNQSTQNVHSIVEAADRRLQALDEDLARLKAGQ